jgi:hypothetical protein
MSAVVLGAPAFIRQNAVADTGNSSVATINAGATFTGAWASTLGVNAVQVSLVCNQNCTVYVDQGADGTNVDMTDAFDYNAVVGNFGMTIQAISAHYRVRVKNNGPLNTTTVRLESVLCPIADPLPRALDEHGNLRTATLGHKDVHGNPWLNNATGDASVAQPYRLVGTIFGGSIDAQFWTATASGTGATASMVTTGVVSLTSSSSGAGYAQLTSVRSARP